MLFVKEISTRSIMQPPQADTHSPASYEHDYQRQIPWWDGLDPTIRAELEIPSVQTLSLPTSDVIVVGGGVAGLSARAAGAEVLVLEREALLGYGATGRNAGILSAGINMGIADLAPESPDAAFWPDTTRLLLSLVAESAQPGSLLFARLTGAISLAENSRAARNLAREARVRTAAGLRADLWTPAQVTEVTQGRLSVKSVVSALWLPDEGRIHPLTLLAYLAKQARAAGVRFAGQANVAAYREVSAGTDGSLWLITLTDGTVLQAKGLISAVGPTSKPTARIFALAFAADLPDNFPLFWDASPYTYADFRPGNGRLTVSGGRYGRAGATRHDANYYKRLADAARRWLPELIGQEPLFMWAVDLDVAAGMIPKLRTLGNVAPGVAIEGLGALGVLPGIVLGRRAGASIAGQLFQYPQAGRERTLLLPPPEGKYTSQTRKGQVPMQ
jgi:glycine/D-amino acid oxidase-like deaminating enzyme